MWKRQTAGDARGGNGTKHAETQEVGTEQAETQEVRTRTQEVAGWQAGRLHVFAANQKSKNCARIPLKVMMICGMN